ncbi:PaaI family thioesterase [Aspergillus saccharolyticus JOP 1030-1]|uniref:Thioesterase domain-containing protein n=1 Tax=Aspergillus saccharolyticus JOP 1030-1 TaxID=1450539 RepID=A0A318ZZ71_9EURO|nr:hypothetical protein BP01DRAFT_340855 [Aspergillus saccharolyticus JOP 1030-1]PYH45388.1 hypothetical protein BP01DRAFT_340855 [Aspergillus saccharolyticus JOP 1030-1]
MFCLQRVLQSRLPHFPGSSRSVARYARANTRTLNTASSQSESMWSRLQRASESRWGRRLFWGSVFFLCGDFFTRGLMGELLEMPVAPGTLQDQARLEKIERQFEHTLPIVQRLRADPDYEEAEVYGNFSEEDKMQRLTSGPLQGSRGIAFQRTFYNDKEKTAVNVAYLGQGLEGWPTMVHGGALGTVIDEHLGRVAIRNLPQRTGVTANLELQYRAPVLSNKFYTFHATLDQERSTERKAYVRGEVRDMVGKLCVEASALFVVPKKYQLREVGERF